MLQTKTGKSIIAFQLAVYGFRIAAEFIFFEAPAPIQFTIITMCALPFTLNILSLKN